MTCDEENNIEMATDAANGISLSITPRNKSEKNICKREIED